MHLYSITLATRSRCLASDAQMSQISYAACLLTEQTLHRMPWEETQVKSTAKCKGWAINDQHDCNKRRGRAA